jgi:protein-tyrosine kinase
MSSIEKFMDRMEHSGSNQKHDDGVKNKPLSGNERNPNAKEVHINLSILREQGILTIDNGDSKIADEYRAIKRPLLKTVHDLKAMNQENNNTIMVTSSLAGEGKSFTSISLAMSMVMERDYTVLLVEADLKKPSITNYMGIDSVTRGLADYLVNDKTDLQEYLLHTNVPKLTILPAGICHENASELMSSLNMRRLMHELSSRYSDRIIIFDSSPLLLSGGALALTSLVGQIVFVVEAGKTLKSVVTDAYQMLDKNKPIGVVVNKSKTGEGAGMYGQYGSYG